MRKLAIITSHPIQYYAPFFAVMAKDASILLMVYYTLGKSIIEDVGFNQDINWDLPLLKGYDYTFLENTAKIPGSHHYSGIVNPGLIASIENFSPDVLLVYGWSYQSHLKAIKHFSTKIPIWFRGDSTLLDKQSYWKKITRKIVLSYIYKHINKAFYVGTSNYEYFNYYGLKPKQLTFAPHAVDNLRFGENRSGEAAEIRERFNIRSDEILILFAGKFENKKNPLLLLNSFKDLNQSNVHLLFVGSGKLDYQLKLAASKLDNRRIHFMGFMNQTEIPAVYQACDIFCLPSQGPGETWGLAVNEAMASAKAILISDKVGCAADLIINGHNGYIFKSGNANDLSEKLNLLCQNRKALKQMGQASMDIIGKWNFQAQAESFKFELNKL